MTPQLQQAIRLLQLSTMDLQQEIQQALDSNPMLEVSEEESPAGSSSEQEAQPAQTSSEGPMDNLEQSTEWSDSGETASPSESADIMPDDLPVDTQWDDLLPSSSAPPPPVADDSPDSDFEARNAPRESLQEQLLWQLNLTRLSDTDRLIALAIIDATDGNGRLQSTLEEIHGSFDPELDIEEDEVVAVLHRLQQFEPAGVCTRDLQECLLVQLQQLHSSLAAHMPAILTSQRARMSLLALTYHSPVHMPTRVQTSFAHMSLLLSTSMAAATAA